MTDYRQPVRSTEVSRVTVRRFPGHEEKWMVKIKRKVGLARVENETLIFQTEIEARSAADRYRSLSIGGGADDKARLEEARAIVDTPEEFQPICGDDKMFLAWHVLREAGIADATGISTLDTVSEFLGSARISALKEQYGDSWSAAAEFEYCLMKVPADSPAFIASASLFAFFCQQDDFAAGYLLRDLEFAVSRVEDELSKQRARSRKAGRGGADHKKGRRLERIVDLVGRMEALFMDNPMARAMQPEELADHAVRNVNTPLWSEGRGQVTNYLTEVRCGDHGEDLKSRYFALFPAQAPKPLS